MSPWLVPPREWPVFAFSFLVWLAWSYVLPAGHRIDGIGRRLLPMAGYYAFHPCHHGQSRAEVGLR